MQNSYMLLSREAKARTLADFLWPRMDAEKMPISTLADMSSDWWRFVADQAGCKAPGPETVVMVQKYLHDRQREALEARNAKDNQSR